MSVSPSVSALLCAASELCVLRGDVADKLIACGDGDGALLYLYILRQGKAFSEKIALEQLKFTKDRYDRAIFTLTSLTLTSEGAAPAPQPKRDAPAYRAPELRQARDGDHRFAAVCDTAEAVLGRTLTESLLRTLFAVYDHLGLPAEVIIELLTYLKREKDMVKRSDIEREACLWADMGLYTAEDAAAFLSRRETERPLIRAMQEALGIGGREPTVKEASFFSEFIAKGFAPDAVALAAHRTEQALGKFSWSYLRKIISSWDEMGVHTLSEIGAADPERTKKSDRQAPPSAVPAATSPAQLADWETDWLEQVRSRKSRKED